MKNCGRTSGALFLTMAFMSVLQIILTLSMVSEGIMNGFFILEMDYPSGRNWTS